MRDDCERVWLDPREQSRLVAEGPRGRRRTFAARLRGFGIAEGENRRAHRGTAFVRFAATDEERESYWRESQRLSREQSILRNHPSDISKIAAREIPLKAALDKAIKAEPILIEQLRIAPNWRDIQDRQDRDKAFGHSEALANSLKILRQGCNEYWNGHPALPGPLREVLTDRCTSCGHEELLWAGSIKQLEDQIAKLQAKRAKLQAELETAMS